MSRIVIFLAIVGLAFHLWNSNKTDSYTDHLESPNGFVSVIMPKGAESNTVWILAPKNCPSDAAQRAEALAEQLTDLGIPYVQSSNGSFEASNPTPELRQAAKHLSVVLNGEIPAVFVNGMGKANPSIDEVVSEYRETK